MSAESGRGAGGTGPWAPWVVAAALAAASGVAAPHMPRSSWAPPPSVLALLLGIAVGAVPGARARLGAGMKAVSRAAIPWAIVAIGCGLDLGPLVRSGQLGAGLAVVLLAMAVAFGAALLAGRLVGLDPRASLLLGAGTAVCGNSAILAVAPTVEPSDEDLGLAIGVINLLGVVMLFALPPLARALGIDGVEGGVVAGVTVHAVPQAIAAGEAFGPEALEWATLYKLLRVAMLVPVVVLLALALRKRRAGAEGTAGTPAVPWFVALFVVAALVRAAGLLDAGLGPEGGARPLWAWAKEGGRFALAVALGAIGVGLELGVLLRVGPRMLLAGALTAAAMIAAALPLVRWLL